MLTKSEYEEILQMRRDVTVLRDELAQTVRSHWARKAGFNEGQPRWPQGTPGSPKPGGRWSGGPGTGTRTINNAQTGISTIDSTTETLLRKLATVIDTLPKGSGPAYGIAVHTVFGAAVRFGNIPGIGIRDVETSWGGGYGSPGSIRTDVILRNDVGDPIAIYDVKTGGAKVTDGRALELREAVAPGSRIPVIEIHHDRGISIKSNVATGNYSTLISARLFLTAFGAE